MFMFKGQQGRSRPSTKINISKRNFSFLKTVLELFCGALYSVDRAARHSFINLKRFMYL